MNNNIHSMLQRFRQFKANPMQYMAGMRLNVPQEIAGDPNQIIQHLMNSGTITQEQYNRANAMARDLRRQFGS